MANERIPLQPSIDTLPFDDGIIFLSNAHGFNHTTNIPRDQIAHIYNDAMKGSSESGFIVGMFYLYGFMGTVGDSDMENAIKWFSKSAADGFVDSQVALGILLYHSEQKSSITWIFQAAMSGNHPMAHYLLARLLCEGASLKVVGIEEDTKKSKYQRAVSHLRKAGSIPEALHLLAVLFEYNLVSEEKEGISNSDAHLKEALKLYKLAVSKGSIESLYNLALMHLYGRGTQMNYSIATTLLLQAAAENHVPSFRFLGLLAMQNTDQPNPKEAVFWLGKCVNLAVSTELKTVCHQELEQVQKIVDIVNRNHRDILNDYKGQTKKRNY